MSSQPVQNEGLFGQIIVARRLAAPADVQLCMEIQANDAAVGAPRRTLGEIMVQRGYITAMQVKLVLEEQRRRQGPRTLGQYELTGKLGEGGMSAVYRARMKSTGADVALKILPRRYSEDAMFLTRFEREARLGQDLDHPNIVRTLDFGDVNGIHYIALEFVDGGSLDKLLKARQILTEQEALQITQEIAKALQHAAEMGMVHRDIKPSNIMLGSKGEVKLTDFGLIKHTDPEASKLTESGLLVGTPHYISPEQARGDKDMDIRADIYSLGATLYHLVTGQTPFTGTSPLVVITQHLKGQLTPPDEINPGLSDGCVAIIEKMMAKERDDRYATPLDLIADVELVLAGDDPVGAGIEIGKSSVKVSAKRQTLVLQRGAAPPRGPRAAGAPARGAGPSAPPLAPPHGKGRSGVVDAAVVPVPVPGRPTSAGAEKLRPRQHTTGPRQPVGAVRSSEAAPRTADSRQDARQWPPGSILLCAAGVIVFVVIAAIVLWPRRELEKTVDRSGSGTLKAEAQDPKASAISKPKETPGTLKPGPPEPSTKPAPAQPAPAAADVTSPAYWKKALNLLAKVDPDKDTVAGTWRLENGRLTSDETGNAANGGARVELPYQPPEEYDFRIVFTRTSITATNGGGDVNQVLSKSGRPFVWLMGGFGNSAMGFETFRGSRADKNLTCVRRTDCLQNGQSYTSVVSVRKDGLKAYLDGTLVTQWKTDCQDMTIADCWKLRDPTVLGLATYAAPTIFERAEVVEVTGQGKFTR